jgi:hypothetical protein
MNDTTDIARRYTRRYDNRLTAKVRGKLKDFVKEIHKPEPTDKSAFRLYCYLKETSTLVQKLTILLAFLRC